MNSNKPVILFDGDCALCNGVVQFVLDNDQIGDLCFASLQSQTGQRMLRQFNLPTENFTSYLVVEGNSCHQKFSAVQRMGWHMGGRWRLLSNCSRIIPRFIGNPCYTLGFRLRYRVFGHNTQCRLLNPQQRDRFLDLGESGFSG